ncbi:MAG: hypothetical protein GEV05_23170 [Betaproteobacteria bacterium]|nr:hypothetical protein [Betaproteobacteria bacterium]
MKRLALYPLVLFGLFSSPAHAYLDPGVGSIILQALAAAAIGVSVFWRGIVHKIKSLFNKNGKASGSENTPDKYDGA